MPSNSIEKPENNKEEYSFEEELKNFPLLEKGRGLWQNDFHEFDVYDHTLKVVEHVKKLAKESENMADPNMVAAAYFHDIGKPATAEVKIKDGVITKRSSEQIYHSFPGHEIIGEKMVRDMPADFFIRHDLDQEKVAKLVGVHFIPMKNIIKMRKISNYQDFVSQYHELERTLDESGLGRKEVMDLFTADSYAKGDNRTDQPELMVVRDAILQNGQGDSIRAIYEIQKTAYGGKE